jgi:mono/diheme cytochrome c family protein
VDLTTYSSIINTADVRAGNPEGSDLYEVLVETDPDKDIMPPPGEGNLSAAQIALIRKWIEQGARNNSCENCDTLNVTFSGTIFPLIQNNCAGCHSGANPQGNISLTNYTQINARVQSGQLFGAVNHEAGFTPMPFNQPKLPPCQLDQIRIWIEAGAPNN